MEDDEDALVWTEETIELVRCALLWITFGLKMSEGAHLDDPWEVPPPQDDWVGSIQQYALALEDLFPGKVVDEPFLQRYEYLVRFGREMKEQTQ